MSFSLVALVIGSMFGGILWNIGNTVVTAAGLTKFSSDQELVNFLKTNPGNEPQSLFQKILTFFQGFIQGEGTKLFTAMTPSTTFRASGEANNDGGSSLDYSTTNIQVEGVDEADIVKTDGEYLYLVSGAVIYILRVHPPEEAKLLSKLNLNTSVVGMYVKGEKLVLMQGGYISDYLRYYPLSEKTCILLYDISNRSAPYLETSVAIDGTYFNSRMIQDFVYVVVNKPAQVTDNEGVVLPEVQMGNTTLTINASNIYYTGIIDYSYYFTSILALNVQDSTQKPIVESLLLGATSNIYVSAENIYLTSSIYSIPYGTRINKVSIKAGNIIPLASTLVSGFVLNQYSMDEYNEFFRIATSDGKSTRVTIFDKDLKAIGKLEDLAPGESLYSARFMNDRCYLVTFKKTDPLFTIDLKDSTNPKVLGQLKIPGYSDYLHPYDENHLIGVGKETIEAENGNFAWYQGVKISLFDVSNISQPKEISKIEIGDRGTDSPVLNDPKAFLFSKSKNLLVLPILLATIDEEKYPLGIPPNTYGDYVWQGAYVLNITLEDGLKYLGGVTHIDNLTDLMNSGYYFSSVYSVKRALYIDNILYTVSDRMVKMTSLGDLKEISAVNLP
ncbi:MAG: beta-propeller domain-containing protein [Candidatus Bathyarchaeota archaeon]